MKRYNLIDEPWIPVRLREGPPCRMGLREVLTEARRIAAIEDPSPLVVAALHRFLLAVLYRALEGPTDGDKAQALFKAGIPEAPVVAYLEKWRDRFWLFHDTHPFGQIPTFEPKEWKPWTVLAAEHNAANAKVLFDHIDLAKVEAIPEASAICWLLATQTFAVSSGKSELAHTGTAPSATAVMVLPQGMDLQDTLLFSLVPIPASNLPLDLPLWERDPESVEALEKNTARLATGLVDHLTWRTRSIRLKAAGGGGVSHLGFASGVHLEPGDTTDPMLGYRIDPKLGRLPLMFRDRGLWRDFDSFLPDGGKNAPRSIEHAVSLTRTQARRFPRSMLVLGQANDKAKIEFWRMERFSLPGALAGARDARSAIRWALDKAEDTEKALWMACSTYARNLLSRGERTVHARDVNAFLDQMLPIPFYWSTMERCFHGLLDGFSQDRPIEEIEKDWLVSARAALREAWGRHLETVSSGDAWAIRAAVKAEPPLSRKAAELEALIQKYQPQEAP